MVTIREIRVADAASILALNAAEVEKTSPLDHAQLAGLLAMSAFSRVAVTDGHVVAFVIALADGAPYRNDNYAFFSARFPRFLYVDRIVVDAGMAGRGIGAALYRDLFDHARAMGVARITCEYNVVPPNPASKAFHDRFGFTEQGTHWVAGGTRRVSLQAADVRSCGCWTNS